jgi:hypothetical protein
VLGAPTAPHHMLETCSALGRWSELLVIKLDRRAEIEQCGGIPEVRALPWQLRTDLLKGYVAAY